MPSPVDLAHLRAAIELAERGLFTTTPNPRVGCVLVRNGETLGRGWHVRQGEAHAEALALADAGGDAAGATAYVSLEPCCFHGHTPPCADALIDAGVARVVAAMTDPHPRVAGRGFERLRQAGVAVEAAELPEAAALNLGWIKRLHGGRPWVRLKVAVSVDGRTAMASGESQWITGPEARADVQYWRARSCAVITGAGTVRADDPQLTVRDERFATDGRLRQPLRVVVSTKGDVPGDAAVLADGDALMACGRGAGEHSEVALHRQWGERVNLGVLLDHLGERECNEVLVEAGPTLIGGFIEADLWDELILYVAPLFLGSDARPLAMLSLSSMEQAVKGRIAETTRIGDDLRLTIQR